MDTEEVIAKRGEKYKPYVIVAILVLVVLLQIFLFAPMTARFAAETYDLATIADDGGDQATALRLFKEACAEGSILACQAIDPPVQADKRTN